MFDRLVIIGAGGHGKVVADIAIKSGYENVIFVDDNATGTCLGFPIVGTCQMLDDLDDGKTGFVIAVGDNEARKTISEKHDVNWTTLIHPSAQIGANVSIGKGTVVMAGSIINSSAVVACHCIVNSGSVVEHDTVLRDYVHVSPCAALGGMVTVGDKTWIGIGAAVRNNTIICSNCIIGAGAVVIDDILESGVYVGVPAKRIM